MKNLSSRFKDITLYPVTSEVLSCGRKDEDVVLSFLQGGAKIVQYRNKEKDKDYILRIAKKLRSITLEYKALLIINDYVDIALSVGADGVHLGQTDLSCKEARVLAGEEFLIGVSCHSIADLKQAEKNGASYANIGPLFPTKTKKISIEPVGLSLFKEALSVSCIPLTVMGGINTNNLETVVKAGARRIAMVSELTTASNITNQVKETIALIDSFS